MHGSWYDAPRMEVAAYSTVAMTLGLVVTRPRITANLRLSPSMAAFVGVFILMALGIVRLDHFSKAVLNLWSPFVAIASIMVITDVALQVGLLQWWAERVDSRASSVSQLFTLVYALGMFTAATLNNDAAILLLTPLVVALVRRRYPERHDLVAPFAFAVFMSAGVAPFPVSNPMNMVVANFSGISFNTYALHMIPVAIAGWAIAFIMLRWLFRKELAGDNATRSTADTKPMTGPQRLMMVLVIGVLISYPVFGYFGGPVWAVALCASLMSLVLVPRHQGQSFVGTIIQGVSWETLAFLLGVLVISMGLFEVGLVDRLKWLYVDGGVGIVGVTSALGSAVLNNHPMSHLNMMALESIGSSDVNVLAALVGGDLGPRLLPMGSLAGLVWLEMLRRQGVEIKLLTFMKIGAIVTVPAMLGSLAILEAF